MLVSLFTDASMIPETRAGAWAMWAKSERGTIRHARAFRGNILTSGEAEAMALANALEYLARSDIFERDDHVLAQLDCMQVIDTFYKRPSVMQPMMREAISQIGKSSIVHGFDLELRHIKGHAGTDTPRHAVHDLCDQHARRLARRLHRNRTGGHPSRG